MADEKPEVDKLTGLATTGHVWDGIRELNTPLPRWWLWIFYATIVWSVGYWIVYPAWPLVSSYTSGAFNWRSRDAVTADLATLDLQRGPMLQKLASTPLEEILADEQLLDFSRALGKSFFGGNCGPCHGAGGGGGPGYPNLNANAWLYGGKLTDIAQTIRYGIHSGDPNGRLGPAMPAFGRDGMLKRGDIELVADYVRSLSGLPVEPSADLAGGKAIFATTCTPCHGEDGRGKREFGAPNLTDAIWLYGPDKATIVDVLWNGRAGVMPAWSGRLSETTIKALAVYVYTLGGGER